jgi:antitoxin (DNA-binding transcriptional repressor) of toxin-antitoxin stability system
MKHVDIDEVIVHLSKLLDQVEAGAELVITRQGVTVARLVAVASPPPPRQPRTPGSLKGKVHMADDFDDVPEDFKTTSNNFQESIQCPQWDPWHY